MWLLLLLLPNLDIHAFPVFSFHGPTDSSATPSFASLVSEVDLLDNFILCFSIKQARFDDISFLSIFGKDSNEWMRMEFRSYSMAIKLALRWDGQYHRLGKLQNPRLDYWYHVCLRLDLPKSKIEVAVNGESLGSILDTNVTNVPSKLKMTIGIGYGNEQFQGSVANILVFKEGNITDISTLPCKPRPHNILSWSPKNWKVEGSSWRLTEEFKEIFCVPRDQYNLAIPFRITFNESLNICKEQLNNSIIPFQEDPHAFLKYVAWHKNVTGGICSSIWTPFSDQKLEGSFLNMNNDAEAKLELWVKGEPNGGRNENFVVIDVPEAALNDVAQSKLSCSSCLVSSSLLLELDGLCKDSLIGNI